MEFYDGKKTIPLTKIGFISKLNGYSGEVVLAVQPDAQDRFEEEEFYFLEMDGLIVPFRVEEIFEKGANIVLRFDGIDSDAAQSLAGKEVFVKSKKKRKAAAAIVWEDLKGYLLKDESGAEGIIERIDSFPQQMMATCKIGDKDVLVPLNEEFILEVDHESRTVLSALPEGLLDL